MAENPLPEEFSDLAPLVGEWSLGAEEQRVHKRIACTREDIEAFHDKAFPRLQAIIEYLNKTNTNDVDQLAPPTRRLYDLALMIMEASQPIDLEWSGSDIGDAFPTERFGFLSPSGIER
jgi:hypothetical protein